MNDFASPGPYIKEVPSGPGPIAGVSTSIMGLIGWSPKGPVNKPILSTSFAEHSGKFGSFDEKGLAGHEAYAYFANEGKALYFVRVTAPDAEQAYWDMTAAVANELVSNAVEATGAYEFSLDHMPVKAGGKITFANASTAANVYVFDINANGTLTLNTTDSGASAVTAGGSGSINLATGECQASLGNPSYFTGGTDWITADYDYVVFRFEMAWPGLAGNFFRVRIAPGSSDYLVQAEARWTRFTVIVEEDKNSDVTNRAWTPVETWSDLVFDDPDSRSYVATIINADGAGSEYIKVVDYGNGVNPSELAGTQVQDEDFSATQRPDGSTVSPPVAYDGLVKGWEYKLASGPFEKTVNLKFDMADGSIKATGQATAIDGTGAALTDSGAAFATGGAWNGMMLVNKTTGATAQITGGTATTVVGQLQGGSNQAWAIGDEYIVIDAAAKVGVGVGTGTTAVASPGSAAHPVGIVPGSVCLRTTMSTAGDQIFVDDGAGHIVGDVTGTPATVATIDYSTGQITSAGSTANEVDFDAAFSSETVASGTSVLFGCVYSESLVIEDDADGNLSLAATQATLAPTKFTLNLSGKNTIDYVSGEAVLTWAIAGNPAAGPQGVYKEVADYYTNPDLNWTESGVPGVSNVLAHGTDGADVSSADVVDPSLAARQEGLYAFGKVNSLMQLVAADFQTDIYVADALITYAELMKDKFVILTVPHGLSYQEAINWKKFQLNKFTSYAAIYYPHIKVMDPVSNTNMDIPCGGHVAGVYARTDSLENVGSAPAGMEKGKLNWSTGLEVDLSRDQVGFVYKEKINALVNWPDTGRVVWGAVTMAPTGSEWKYIQTRRLFEYAEASVYNASFVYAFADGGASLQHKIKRQVTTFLTGLATSNYLASTVPSEAFFVVSDSSNNTKSTIDQGLTFVDVGLASKKPGEFLVFRFQQKSLASGE